jgi:hypothetical protein
VLPRILGGTASESGQGSILFVLLSLPLLLLLGLSEQLVQDLVNAPFYVAFGFVA